MDDCAQGRSIRPPLSQGWRDKDLRHQMSGAAEQATTPTQRYREFLQLRRTVPIAWHEARAPAPMQVNTLRQSLVKLSVFREYVPSSFIELCISSEFLLDAVAHEFLNGDAPFLRGSFNLRRRL